MSVLKNIMLAPMKVKGHSEPQASKEALKLLEQVGLGK